MKFHHNDAGRFKIGWPRHPGKDVCRAVAIVSERPYLAIHEELLAAARCEPVRKWELPSHPDTGMKKATYKAYLWSHGFRWTCTTRISGGCCVHLCAEELLKDRLLVQVNGRLTAVVDGVIHDIEDLSLGVNRCVYGYWEPAPPDPSQAGDWDRY